MTAIRLQFEPEERRLLRDSAADYVARALPPGRLRASRELPEGFDRSRLREMAAFGWIRLALAEEAGGLGLGCAEAAALHEELGRGAAPEPVAVGALAAGALAASASQAVRQRWLERVLSGEALATLAWQAEDGGDEPACTAAAEAGGWRLDGSAAFVPLAGIADLYVVAAAAPQGTALFAVEAGSAGLAAEATRAADHSVVGSLRFDALRLPAEACLVAAERGKALLERLLERARLEAAAELCGAMGKALELTLAYMRTRVQFGRPIGAFQAQQHKAVDLYVQLELAQASVAAAASALDDDSPEAALRVAAAKARASDAGILIGGRAVHLHGAIGVTEEYDLGLYLRRIHFLAAWLGNGNAMRRRYAALLGAQEAA